MERLVQSCLAHAGPKADQVSKSNRDAQEVQQTKENVD